MESQPPHLPDPDDGPSQPDVNDRLLAVLSHVSLLLGFGLIVPLVLFLIMKDQSAFVNRHSKEALNFHITVTIATIVCIPLCFILIGFLLILVIALGAIVLAILATIEAAQDRDYQYPVTLRLVR